jgi:hypothetical protein
MLILTIYTIEEYMTLPLFETTTQAVAKPAKQEVENLKRLLFADTMESFMVGLEIVNQETYELVRNLKHIQSKIRSQKLRFHETLIPLASCPFGPDQGKPFVAIRLEKLIVWYNNGVLGKQLYGSNARRVWEAIGPAIQFRKVQLLTAIKYKAKQANLELYYTKIYHYLATRPFKSKIKKRK